MTESTWNDTETTEAWEHASWDESAARENEADYQDEGFADEDEEEAFTLAGTQLHETLAAERNARRTVAQARAIMHEIKSSGGG